MESPGPMVPPLFAFSVQETQPKLGNICGIEGATNFKIVFQVNTVWLDLGLFSWAPPGGRHLQQKKIPTNFDRSSNISLTLWRWGYRQIPTKPDKARQHGKFLEELSVDKKTDGDAQKECYHWLLMFFFCHFLNLFVHAFLLFLSSQVVLQLRAP